MELVDQLSTAKSTFSILSDFTSGQFDGRPFPSIHSSVFAANLSSSVVRRWYSYNR